ncbi:MAG TPA: hypothetical protein PKK26_09495 [Candidatus Wallbacteria bacterium]|nr:hypothetical protein [Candidatus Wallbacteria bacterium]
MFRPPFKKSLKNFTVIIACLLTVIFSAGSAYAKIDTFRICSKNSEAFLYINVSAFKNFLEANKTLSALKKPAEKIKELTSVDVFKEINSFVATLNGLSNLIYAKNPDGAFIFEGYFRAGEIEKKLTAAGIKSETFSGVNIFKIDEDVFLAVASEKFLLYGNSAEIKSAISLISAKTSDSLETDEFFKSEIDSPENKTANVMICIKIPKAISAMANSVAKVNSDQAMFSNLKSFSFSASGSSMTLKYKYETKEDAAKSVDSAKDFMEKGFSQLAENSKKLNEADLDKTKVNAGRLNFVKSGIRLFLKLRTTMKIEANDKDLFLRFNLTSVNAEMLEFLNAMADSFLSAVSGKTSAKPADAKQPAAGSAN